MRRLLLTLGLFLCVAAPAQAAWGPADLILGTRTFSDVEITDRYFDPADCAVVEGAISSAGWHRLIEFSTQTANVGTGPLEIGRPSASDPDFEWFACHNHWHFKRYAEYRLLDSAGQAVGLGHKQSFCVIDVELYDPLLTNKTKHRHYWNCGQQGLSVGWADLYWKGLDGQWVEIDGVPPGVYTLENTVNYAGVLPESDYTNNTKSVQVVIP